MTTSLIQQASASLRDGQFDEASSALEAALATAPHDAGALRMLGTVRYLTNHFDEAAELLRRSLAVEPDNTKTLLNAGAVMLALKDFGQAEDLFVRLVGLSPNSADAHFNLGVTYQRSGRSEPAVAHYTEALRLDADHADAETNLAAVCLTLRDYVTSVQFSDRALKRNPNNTQAQLSRARAHKQLGHMDEAGSQLRTLLKGSPSDPMLATEWGNYLVALGRYDEARVALQTVLETNPEHLNASRSLVSILLELGQFDEAVALSSTLTTRHPEIAELWAQLGAAQAKSSRTEGAVDSFERAIVLAPDSVSCLLAYAQTLIDQGQLRAAEPLLERVSREAPQLAPAHALRTRIKMRKGEHEQALEVCEEYLQRQPCERSMLAEKSLILSALGRDNEYRHLVDLDRFVSESRPQAPSGFASLGEFNAALAEHVRTHPSLADSPRSHATLEGLHSGPLRVEPRGPIGALENILYAAAKTYMKALGVDAGHPFLVDPPELDMLYCWGVVMRRQGHQTAHIHPAAWLSGIYYPKVPEIVDTSSSDEGWLEFGATADEFGLPASTPSRRIKPSEGLLLVFPSYFYHRTIPFEADQERISIAFDLFPKTNALTDSTQWITSSLVSFA